MCGTNLTKHFQNVGMTRWNYKRKVAKEVENCDLKTYNSILMVGLLNMCLILLHRCAHFSRDAFEVNLDLFPGLTAPAALSAPMMNDSFEVH